MVFRNIIPTIPRTAYGTDRITGTHVRVQGDLDDTGNRLALRNGFRIWRLAERMPEEPTRWLFASAVVLPNEAPIEDAIKRFEVVPYGETPPQRSSV